MTEPIVASETHWVRLKSKTGVNGAPFFLTECSCGKARVLGCEIERITEQWKNDPSSFYPECDFLKRVTG